MTQYDFRDTEPLYVHYATFVGGNSNKFYEVRIDLADSGLYVLTKRWGARPDQGKGQIKVETYAMMPSATAQADAAIAAKISRGYRPSPRPDSANGQVDSLRSWQDDED